MCRFGIPRHLVSDNGTQFVSQQLGKLCSELRIKHIFASMEHPQTNGQVESVNQVLLRGLKRRLEKAKGTWSEEVPQILWKSRKTPLVFKILWWRNPTKEKKKSKPGSAKGGPRASPCQVGGP